jgi:ubiquitin-protein ligase E3 C
VRTRLFQVLHSSNPFHSFEEQQIEQPTGSRPLSKRQVAYMSPRLGVLNNVPFAIPFEVRVSIFRNFVVNDMVSRGVDRHRRTGRTRVSVRRGSVAQDGFDKLEGADLKAPIEITFIDQFGQEEYVPNHFRTSRRLETLLINRRAGIDGGGVFKEFFTSLCKEVFDTDRGLWLANKKNELYPNPHAYATERELPLSFCLCSVMIDLV